MGKCKSWFKKRVRDECKQERTALGFKKQSWGWDFKIWTPTDYELEIVFSADNKLFLTIFQQSREKLQKKGVNQEGDPELIDRFVLDEQFYNLVKTYLKKPFSITARDVLEKHGFQFLDYYVVKGWFERGEGRDWKIHIILKGTYADKR